LSQLVSELFSSCFFFRFNAGQHFKWVLDVEVGYPSAEESITNIALFSDISNTLCSAMTKTILNPNDFAFEPLSWIQISNQITILEIDFRSNKIVVKTI
jgi:hypothetical protein